MKNNEALVSMANTVEIQDLYLRILPQGEKNGGKHEKSGIYPEFHQKSGTT